MLRAAVPRALALPDEDAAAPRLAALGEPAPHEQGVDAALQETDGVDGVVGRRPRGEREGGGDEDDEQREAAADEVQALRRLMHQTICKVSGDLETFDFNTAVAALMAFSNGMGRAKDTPVVKEDVWKDAIQVLILLLAPITPHLSEELWSRIGGEFSVHQQGWPEWDEELARPSTLEIPVQVNGRVRARFETEADAPAEALERLALEQPNVRAHLEGKELRKIIVVPNRLVNIVV